MKIKTITCHDVYNYGASLQAYALMHYLQTKGHQVEIIDYKPDYLSNHYKLGVANPIYDKPLIKQLYLLAKLYPHLRSLKRKRLFDFFKEQYLKLTPECYHSNAELKQNPPLADLYLAGSDQIWNTLFPNGKDPAFYLDFVPKGKVKASYAASMATEKIASGWENFVYEKVMNLDHISVRERSAVDILKQIGVTKDISVVCDPVFLLDTNDWLHLLKDTPRIIKKSYLLVYDFDRSQKIKEIAQYIANKRNLKIIPIGPTAFGQWADFSINVGPIEFLNLINNAELIISNSFHATAFSILFKKDFFVVKREENLNTRMEDLLKALSLENRLVSSLKSLPLSSIDYSEDKVEKLRKMGQVYLNRLLES